MPHIGRFEIDLELRYLSRGGEAVHIGARAFDILAVLVSSVGRIVSKNELMDAVWPDTVVEENNLQVHLSSLRKILGPDRGLIVTIPGRGYQLRQNDAALLREADHMDSPAPLPAKSRLVGRDAAVDQILSLLEHTEVLTLAGAGGIGKTSLAIEVAHRVAARSPERLCFLELASLNTREDVLNALAAACGLVETADRLTTARVVSAFAGQRMFLVLDNAEHVVGWVAEVVEAMLGTSDASRIMVTSREPLRIMSEVVFRVEALDVPAADADHEAIRETPAVAMFLLRANAMQRKLDIDRAELGLVGEICRRLDGIPLALELAAARAAALGVEAVYRRLDNRMTILSGGYRTALPRHQTLRATFDWSFDLLDARAQMLFRRLAMFRGAFELESMCAVVCDADLTVCAVIDSIGELVTKFMVNVEFVGAVARYRLPESNRAYALERLAAEGETRTIATRNARHVASRFRSDTGCASDTGYASDTGCASNTGCASGVRLAGEADAEQTLDEARNAADWAFSDEGDPLLGVELTATLVDALLARGLIAECATLATRAVQVLDALPPATVDALGEIRIRAALATAVLNVDGPIRRSAELWRDVLQRASETGNDTFQARALWGMWNAMLSGGKVHDALAWANRFHQFGRSRRATWQMSLATQAAAIARHCLGQHSQARTDIEACIAHLAGHPSDAAQIARFAVNPLAICYSGLARIVWLQGEPEKAMQFADKAVDLVKPELMEPWLTHVLGMVAVPLALLSGDHRRCRHYLEIMRSQTAQHRFHLWHDYTECIVGALDVMDGQVVRGLEKLERSVDALIARGFRRLITPLVVACAETLIVVGRVADASARLQETLHFCSAHGALFFLPEIWRVLGLAAQAQPATAHTRRDTPHSEAMDASACFLEAIRLAREHEAKMWELRATLCLARLWLSQGRRDAALERLKPLAAWFDTHRGVPQASELFDLIGTLRGSVGVCRVDRVTSLS